ncbi:glycoside hydrolase family 88/105 protein [Breznakiella homolactica]|uniref:Glycoside hydrolase family 88 protein n=1 Tax=Breznakiella homolactica TaxID=2798577 RepID=A0A7T7XQV1_9SPIR|nr:glycoside hydrolase family 88 protein [Breznakiella homolactica]QQO10808.1 glycoside hydrolase family 88 protein [Breznakiella homolactica]
MEAIDKTKPVSERMALSVKGRYTPSQMKWHYEHGLVLQALYTVGKRTNNAEYGGYVKKMYDTKILPDGSIDTYRENEFNLDQINAGKNLFTLYSDTGEEKYKLAINRLREQLRNQPRTKSRGFWHKQIYPWQMWLDGLYMQGPFYAQYIAEFGPAGDWEDLVHQFVLVEAKTRDPVTGLLYHAWDESRKQLWSNPETGCSPHFWGRAMGWYCMALLDVLDFLPDSPAAKTYASQLQEIAVRLIIPVLKFQDTESGLWYQILDQPTRSRNYLESSASSMFTYFLFKMIRKGYVPASDTETVKQAAKKGYAGLLKHMLTEEKNGELHLNGICSVAGLGGTPYRDGSYEYYVNEPVVTDDFKGVGPFIYASMEHESAGN